MRQNDRQCYQYIKKLVWVRDLVTLKIHYNSNLNFCAIVYLEQDADAQVHEGLGEVDDALPGVVDGHGGDGQVGALQANTTTNHDGAQSGEKRASQIH
jgi:hypothetical protein